MLLICFITTPVIVRFVCLFVLQTSSPLRDHIDECRERLESSDSGGHGSLLVRGHKDTRRAFRQCSYSLKCPFSCEAEGGVLKMP